MTMQEKEKELKDKKTIKKEQNFLDRYRIITYNEIIKDV